MPARKTFWDPIQRGADRIRERDESAIEALGRYLATPEGQVHWKAYLAAPAPSPADLGPNAPGHMVRLPNDVWAYVPDPLPPRELVLSATTLELLASAEQAVSDLASLAAMLARSSRGLMRGLRRRAAAFSCGVRRRDIPPLLIEASPSCRMPEGSDVLAAYAAAQDWAVAQVAGRQVDVPLLQAVHARLLGDADPSPRVFRHRQSYLQESPEQPVECARYVPAPAQEVPAAMDSLDGFIQNDAHHPLLVKIALAHYQMVTIHPFDDGNGRVARIFITLMLRQGAQLEAPILPAARLLAVRRFYADRLCDAGLFGQWELWLNYFLEAVSADARDTLQIGTQLVTLRDGYRRQAEEAGLTSESMALIDSVFACPVMCLDDVQADRQGDLRALAGLGILVDARTDERFAQYAPDAAAGVCWVAEGIAGALQHMPPR